jgi:NAD(P)-dependent dehydrogenase (short-subunit alcohol dehydrogenase family)
MGLLSGRTAIVTGSGTGIGRGIALALTDAGANLVLCGRTAETLRAVRGEIEGRGGSALDVVCDITIADDRAQLVAAALDRFGGINILINNATFIARGTLLEVPDEDIQAAWDAGPVAALQLMRLCHPHLKDGGAIVNVSSGAAIEAKVPLRGIYAATKAALNAISRTAANEWGPDGIRVNVIMPIARTEPLERFLANEPEAANAITSRTALGRIGDCEQDIGRAVAFLVGPDAAYITGATIPLDGGTGYIR